MYLTACKTCRNDQQLCISPVHIYDFGSESYTYFCLHNFEFNPGINSCGFRGGWNGTGTGFSPIRLGFLPI